MINHELLTAKLKAYDIDDSNLRLFESYESNKVSINGYRCSLLNITHVVAQRSILGFLLFLVFHK